MLTPWPGGRLLDLGTSDGSFTLRVAPLLAPLRGTVLLVLAPLARGAREALRR